VRRPGFTILHIEDDPDDVLLTHDAFAEAGRGTELIVARDGEEALRYRSWSGCA
jgi:CheY-like chemotaxis protein